MAVVRLLALLLVLLAPLAARGDEALSFAPANSEMVVSINARAVTQSPIFTRALSEIGGPRAEGGLILLRNLTGTDITRDIERIHLWGRLQDDASVGIHVRGRLNQENLLALVKMNRGYRTGEVLGTTVHQWFDEGSGQNRFGTFLPDGSLLMAHSLGAMEAALAARQQNRNFLGAPAARRIPSDAGNSGVWVMLLRPERAIEDPNLRNLLHANAAFLRANPTPSNVELRTRVFTESEARATQWRRLLEGVFAFAQLQDSDPFLAILAERAAVGAAPGDAAAVDVALTVTNDEALQFLRDRAGR